MTGPRIRHKPLSLRTRMGHERYDALSQGQGGLYADEANWIVWERKDGTLSQMHILSQDLDGRGHPMTLCHALTRVTDGGDIAWVYAQNEADKFAREQPIKRCPECFAALAQHVWPDYRERKAVMADQDMRWEMAVVDETEKITLRVPPRRAGHVKVKPKQK